MQTVTTNNTKSFDFCLKEGMKYENLVAQIIQGDKVEVKTEIDKWFETGNIAIEFRYRNSPSGIASTEAVWWIHVLSYKGKVMGFFVFPVALLKKFIRENFKNKNMMWVVNGGDNNWSKLLLIRISELHRIFSQTPEHR